MKRKLIPLIDINDVRWEFFEEEWICPDFTEYSNIVEYLRDNFSFEKQKELLVYGWQELAADGYTWVLNPESYDKLRNYKQLVPTDVIHKHVNVKPTSDLTDFLNMVKLNEQGKSVMTPPFQVEEEEQKEADSKCLNFSDNVPCEDNDAIIDDSQDYSEAMAELTEVFAQCKEETERELNLPADVQSQSQNTERGVLTTSNVQAVSQANQANQATDEKKQSSDDWLGEIRKGLKKKKDVKEFTQKEQSKTTEEEPKDDQSKKEDVPQTVIQSIDSSIAAKQCSTLPEGKQGLEALNEYLKRNIKLSGVYDNGTPIASGEKLTKSYTSDTSGINRWINEGIKIFRFIPKDAGWVCLDIDWKNGKDGVKDLFSFFIKQRVSENYMPKKFQEFPNNFPCWVKTPSGGYHLYFKVPDGFETKKLCLANYPSVEIMYSKPINVAGSYKDGKPYVLYGSFDNIPELPNFIQTTIASKKIIPKTVQKGKTKFKGRWQKGSKDWGKPSWDNIVKWTDEDNGYTYAGRNENAFKLACKARAKGYAEYETLQWLMNEPSVNTLLEREIENAVKSAYKYNQ